MELTHVHTLSKNRFAECERRRMVNAVRRAAVGLPRLLPVVYRGHIIAWCGWSHVLRESVAFEHRRWMEKHIDKNGLLFGYSHVDDIINNVTANNQIRQFMWVKVNTDNTPTVAWTHTFNLQGFPGVGTMTGTALAAQQKSDTTAGAMMHGGNVSPATKHLIASWAKLDTSASATDPSVTLLYDMVLTYEQCVNSTSLQSFTNGSAAQRYIGAGDPGLRIMSCYGATAANQTNFSQVRYTSITGTAPEHVVVPGSTMTTPAVSSPPTTGAGAVSAFGMNSGSVRSILETPLRNGDAGVKQLDDYTMGATNTDVINFILGYHLAWIPQQIGDWTWQFDWVKQAPSLPRIRDGACLTHAVYSAGGNGFGMGGHVVGWA
jgi:hypothetical protein